MSEPREFPPGFVWSDEEQRPVYKGELRAVLPCGHSASRCRRKGAYEWCGLCGRPVVRQPASEPASVLAGIRYVGPRNLRYENGSRETLYVLSVEHPNGPWDAIFCKTEEQARALAALAAARGDAA